jgi:hypothetical protein
MYGGYSGQQGGGVGIQIPWGLIVVGVLAYLVLKKKL